MARNVRTYDHFCLLARALERLGDRWTLLVVRDLLTGPKRFTDLMDRLGGITPKTLTLRLRELDEGGVVQSDRVPGRREVWYQLTPAGIELTPVIQELAWWGWRHAGSMPSGGQRLHPEHLLLMLQVLLDHAPRLRSPARWHLRFLDDGVYILETDGHEWTLTSAEPADADDADVAVVATTANWMSFVLDPTAKRAKELDVEITGSAPAARRFERVLRNFPDALAQSPAQRDLI